MDNNCFGSSGFRCYEAVAGSEWFRLADPFCDPNGQQGCVVQLGVDLEFPGLQDMIAEDGLFGSPTPWVLWFAEATAPACGTLPPYCDPAPGGGCGLPGGLLINEDLVETWVQQPGVTCKNGASLSQQYSLRAMVCPTGCRVDTVVDGLTFGGPKLVRSLGCPDPLPGGCGEPGSCSECKPGGTPIGGGGPGFGGAGFGFGGGAFFYYQAGGAGGEGLPGSPAWNSSLGRYWSHDYARRIVVDPDPSQVWLITRYATFRKFSNPDTGGIYQMAAPSDEVRTLVDLGAGWRLSELDGSLHDFDSAGRWLQTVDRNGNAIVAGYTGGELTSVTFPDGRSEAFAYHPDGKLASVTVQGIDGSPQKVWSLTWSGDDLMRLGRPDGTAVELFYEDGRHPGFITRMEAVGTDLGRRVERGWAYDDAGNVVDSWKGDLSATGPASVDRWQLVFDDPVLPSQTTVTDPLGDTSVYDLDRDAVSNKVKVIALEGDCPECGTGPNSQLTYGDPSHPLRPTEITDGSGIITRLAYDAHGQVTSRTEAANDPGNHPDLPRVTSWQYHPDFPAFPTVTEGPFTEGAIPTRRLDLSYDPLTGDLQLRTVSGEEATYPTGTFVLSTDFTYNTAGRVLTIDPPGYGTDDLTSFTYDPARGDLLPLSRTDPLVGSTTFSYDPLNRRTSVTDVNGMRTDTCYDALDRVVRVIQRGDGPPAAPCDDPLGQAGDLVTRYDYTPLGDLLRTTLPRGNVIEYGYDAAGRRVSIERKPDAVTPGERTLYQLDAAGNRIREEQQRWDGVAWVTEAATAYEYANRCQLTRSIQAPGAPEESITEYAYDCDGNLERLWDANHPSAGQTAPATSVYAYDELDRLVSVTQPWAGAGGGSAVTSYGYDVQDHLTSVTDAEGNLTSYTYSERDLLTAEASAYLATGATCGPFPDCSQAGCGCTRHAYNDHGELVESTDPRGILTARTVDAADRVTLVDYPDNALDITYTYDVAPAACGGTSFPLGRLASISRDGQSVDYCFDRFGRLTQDGALAYGYDSNGNRTEIGYPVGSVTALYSFDFADHPVSLTARRPGQADQPLVTAAEYLPNGPLASLSLASGSTENRGFDGRYQPTGITLGDGSTTQLDWSYATDAVGNPTAITDQLDPASDRTFAYQDVHYFLTGADGPWGSLAWSYDEIGNRLAETRDGITDNYSYLSNGTGNSPILDQIQLGAGGTRSYQFGAAGHLEAITEGASPLLLTSDDAGRLTRIDRPTASAFADFRYDGRSFLARADSEVLTESHQRAGAGATESPLDERSSAGAIPGLPTDSPVGLPEGAVLFADDFESGDACAWTATTGYLGNPCPTPVQRTTVATYDSAGQLHAVDSNGLETIVLYFAGRPVALHEPGTTETETFRLLTTDHLGTPILATDLSATVLWSGGFEPFGQDYAGAQAAGVFLRLPGQWEDASWGQVVTAEPFYYNVFRWYEAGTGRYGRVDPLTSDLPGRVRFLALAPLHPYGYAESNPSIFIDPMGLTVRVCERPNEIPQFDGVPVLDDLPHRWFQTDTTTAGLGQADGTIPGDEAPRCGCDGTMIVDHTQEMGKPGVRCRIIEDVDEECGNRELQIGKPQGIWVPVFNDCWSFVGGVIARCRATPPIPEFRGPTSHR